MNMVSSVEEAFRREVPQFNIGDTVRIHVRVVEGDKERIQPFEGVVIGRKGSGIKETFMLRKVSHGIGVERLFPVHSPVIEKLEVIRQVDVRRAKLYYLRDMKGNAAKVKEKEHFRR